MAEPSVQPRQADFSGSLLPLPLPFKSSLISSKFLSSAYSTSTTTSQSDSSTTIPPFSPTQSSAQVTTSTPVILSSLTTRTPSAAMNSKPTTMTHTTMTHTTMSARVSPPTPYIVPSPTSTTITEPTSTAIPEPTNIANFQWSSVPETFVLCSIATMSWNYTGPQDSLDFLVTSNISQTANNSITIASGIPATSHSLTWRSVNVDPGQ